MGHRRVGTALHQSPELRRSRAEHSALADALHPRFPAHTGPSEYGPHPQRFGHVIVAIELGPMLLRQDASDLVFGVGHAERRLAPADANLPPRAVERRPGGRESIVLLRATPRPRRRSSPPATSRRRTTVTSPSRRIASQNARSTDRGQLGRQRSTRQAACTSLKPFGASLVEAVTKLSVTCAR